MCDQNYLASQKIGRREPSAILWGGVGCSGSRVDIRPGTYRDLQRDMIDGEYTENYDGVSGMWVPPTYRVRAYSGTNLTGTQGLFEPGLHMDLENPQTTDLNRREIKSVQFERIKRWDQHLIDCCSGKVANGATPDSCGPYWGKGNDKGGECDEIAKDYCAYRPNDRRCSCYSRPSWDPEETSEMAAVRESPVCYSQECNIYGYIPTSMEGRNCPSLTVCYSNRGPDGTLSPNVKQVDCNKPVAPVVLPVDPEEPDPETPDPATTDPATTDPATTDPATTDPATTDPATTDPATTDPPPATPPPSSAPDTRLIYMLILLIVVAYFYYQPEYSRPEYSQPSYYQPEYSQPEYSQPTDYQPNPY
jgi:hypothetical protein